MARKRQTAADYVERHGDDVQWRLGQIAEKSARISAWWEAARSRARDHPDEALAMLIDAEVNLDEYVQFAATDCMRKVRAAVNRLEAELPAGRAGTEPVPLPPRSDGLHADRRN